MTNRVTVQHGDCLDVLADIAAGNTRIDAVVTDPPYGLGFMGKHWDATENVAFRPDTWAAVLACMKPGAHLLAFGGTRTFHRLMVAIEDAGFEIRDTFMWVYGTGFPKSLDVSKAIDKAAGVVREVVGRKLVTNAAQGKGLGHGSLVGGSVKAGLIDVTAPTTDAAREWEGWGTAVKPAWEPIILARKPLEGTVAQNVLKHGTGGLNIDGCRVEPTGESRPREHEPSQDRRYTDQGGTTVAAKPGGYAGGAPEGRFPANLIHDGSDEVVGLFPQSTGQLAAVGPENKNNREIYGSYGPRDHTPPRNDTGSAARFFYCAKATADDRHGSKHPTVKPLALIRYLIRLITPPNGVVLDPFAGSGTTGAAALRENARAILIEREAEYVADIHRRVAAIDGTDAPLFQRAP